MEVCHIEVPPCSYTRYAKVRPSDNICKGKKPLLPPLPLGNWSNKPSINAAAISARQMQPEPAPSITESSSVNTSASHEEPADDANELYCKECYMPLHPDPPPGKLYIFLHALRYTTSHGSFETEMPWWALDGWSGEGWVKYD